MITSFPALAVCKPINPSAHIALDTNRDRWGIEPICIVLAEQACVQIAPGTYHAHKTGRGRPAPAWTH